MAEGNHLGNTAPLVLLIDDDAEIRYSLNRVLSARGYRAVEASGGQEGIALAAKHQPPVVFLDNRMEGMNGIETLQHLRRASPHSMVILMTAFGTTQTAIEAMKYGAYDYIIKPFDIGKILSLTQQASLAHRDLTSAVKVWRPLVDSADYREGIVGSSEVMREVFKKIGQVAATNVTVMVTGESGTGKELVARGLWQHSLRADKPFLPVNCAAIPENLIESELFGHEKGSFTGATGQRLGKFELGDGGTLFLDEIGDMTLATQTKILRAIQQGEIQRVGGEKTVQVNVRVIAATNKNLEAMVADKSFREDLYYRLNVMRIHLPALRERKDDIPHLVDFMLQRLAREHKLRTRSISPEAVQLLTRYDWPGNVRELENVIHRSAVVAGGEIILPKDLPEEIKALANTSTAPLAGVEPTTAPMPPSGTDAPPPSPAKAAPGGSETDPTAALPDRENPAPALPPPPPPPPWPLPPDSSSNVDRGVAPESGLEATYDRLYERLRREIDENLLEKIELAMIVRALRETGGNQVKTAVLLGITRATLRKRIEEHRLRIPSQP